MKSHHTRKNELNIDEEDFSSNNSNSYKLDKSDEEEKGNSLRLEGRKSPPKGN